MTKFDLWNKVPGLQEETPCLEYYPAENKKTDATVVILPGGGYGMRAPHEGEGYALYFNSLGMDAFVCEYRVNPHRFPLPLLDARRAVRFVRANAEKFGIDKNKVAIMGSSAGGHLAALTSTYTAPIDFEGADEIDNEAALPNLSILCYPVISDYDTHEITMAQGIKFSCEKLVNETTPPAFIWHTSDDSVVHVGNSMRYGEALRNKGVKFELHVFPEGVHGLGLAPQKPYVSRWADLLKEWLKLNDFLA